MTQFQKQRANAKTHAELVQVGISRGMTKWNAIVWANKIIEYRSKRK